MASFSPRWWAFESMTVLMIVVLSAPWSSMMLSPSLVTAQQQQQAEQQRHQLKPAVPLTYFQKAIDFVKQEPTLSSSLIGTSGDDILTRLTQRDVHALYEVAKAMNANSEQQRPDYKVTSMELWHALADGGHILSQVALGFAYAEVDKPRAIAYFVNAGENGPHQVALYNAGRLLADEQDFVKALAYLRGAHDLSVTDPKYATDSLTETSRIAYELLSEQLVATITANLDNDIVINIQQVADMFLYANLSDFPPSKSKEEMIWKTAMHAMQDGDWELASQQLTKLEKASGGKLSSLQSTLLHTLQEYSTAAGRGNTMGVGEL